jgi:ABC-type transport system involved in cytochrome bd biosynthesis fused ATPase/permease subunit
MDRILVLKDGQVIEDGSPRELAHRGGAFARLWRMQSDGQALSAVRPPLKVVGLGG